MQVLLTRHAITCACSNTCLEQLEVLGTGPNLSQTKEKDVIFKIFTLVQQVQSQIIGLHRSYIFLIIWKQKSVNLNYGFFGAKFGPNLGQKIAGLDMTHRQ